MSSTDPSTGPTAKPEAEPSGEADSATATRARDDGKVELVYDDTPAPPGRPVRLEPTPTGFWRLLGGAIVAVLAPFFGILIGSTLGAPDVSSTMDPLFYGFFIGCVIGALGLVSVGLGARQLMRNARPREPKEEGL
jgi:hypothetical protein